MGKDAADEGEGSRSGKGLYQDRVRRKYVMRSQPWKPGQCGVSYGAQAVMINYQGDRDTDGLSVIRGGLFSNVIGVVSCRDGETQM